jgi:hypothetical protein
MACDRFVYFRKDVPSRERVQKILENFFGGCGTLSGSSNHPSWWTIVLPGKPTSPFEGLPDGHRHPTFGNETRWIEVILQVEGGASLNVLTRVQDEFTNAIADGLARAFARFYQGKLDDD